MAKQLSSIKQLNDSRLAAPKAVVVAKKAAEPPTNPVIVTKIQKGPTLSQVAPRSPDETKPAVIQRAIFSMKNYNPEHDLPIVYSPNYNIHLFGVELLHQFDSKKYSKLAHYLSDNFLDTPFARHRVLNEPKGEESRSNNSGVRCLRYLSPNRPVNLTELEIHHKRSYVDQVHEDKSVVAKITEIWMLNLIPSCLLERRLFSAIRWQVAGSLFSFHLAMQNGWAINLAGGFHHSSADSGETFCLFSDVCLAMKYVWKKHPLQKFMIIDLDAHQATGIERDLVDLEPKYRKLVYMVDLFNTTVQPSDAKADQGVNLRVELGRFTGDATYLQHLDDALKSAFSNFKPNLIIYIAGQDILQNDPLGLMNVTDTGLMTRDERVFSWATEKERCPIVMLLGGGYLSRSSKVFADSIRNLYSKGLIWGGFRSGSRTLTRPRKSAGAVKTGADKSLQQVGTPNAVSLSQSSSGGRRTTIVRAAPVGSKFLTKKAN